MSEKSEPRKSTEKHEKAGLTARQERAIRALLSCPSIESAAAEAGCSRRSIELWLRDNAEFKATFLEARRAIMDAAVLDLQRAYSQAANVLISLLDDTNSHVQLRSADLIMSRADKWIETEDLEARISALEQQVGLFKLNGHNGGRRG
jgi:hypothetical protein